MIGKIYDLFIWELVIGFYSDFFWFRLILFKLFN